MREPHADFILGPGDVLTVDDVAALLKLTRKGVYGLVAARRIPHFKVSNRVRFSRSDVVAWLHENRVPSVGVKK